MVQYPAGGAVAELRRSASAVPQTETKEGLAAELGEVLRDHCDHHVVPGSAAGVLVDGECMTASYGVTNIEHPLDADAATLFQIRSIAKTFTAAAVMLLVEEGHVSLDDVVSKHLPGLGSEIGVDLDGVTVEQLLSHQAGFDGDHLMAAPAERLEQLRGVRVLFAAGDGFSYNNA